MSVANFRLLVGAIALAAALAGDEARAAIVFADPSASLSPAGQQADVFQFQAYFKHVLGEGSEAAFDGMSSGPIDPQPPSDGGDDSPRSEVIRTLHAGAGMSPPAASSLSFGPGSSLAAIPNGTCRLPDSSLETRLPGEPAIVLTTGPPFELLRPA